MQNRAQNSKITWIGLLGQKRADIFKFAFFVQKSLRNYELLEISVYCQKRKENKRFLLFNLKFVRKRTRNCKFT